ncbi:hypothetical protein [Methanoregula sp.]|uniref:hypothetical protein n=1 Tax=Methanoregula sp. TaxID=2052170 RepID=UPI00236F1384|nr:hypothetical protein [Methanoregula sp.]MDD1687027.1 hypothetical protein [Methanoregula sp.]
MKKNVSRPESAGSEYPVNQISFLFSARPLLKNENSRMLLPGFVFRCYGSPFPEKFPEGPDPQQQITGGYNELADQGSGDEQ